MPRMVSLPHRHTARGCRVRAIARRAAAAADAAGRRRTSGTGATWPAGRRRFHLDPATDLASPRVRGLRLGARPQHRADGQSGIRDAGPPRQAPLPVPHPGEPDWVEPGWHLRARPRPRPSVGGAPGDHTGQPVWHEDTCETRSAWASTGMRICTPSGTSCRWKWKVNLCRCRPPRSTRAATAWSPGRRA